MMGEIVRGKIVSRTSPSIKGSESTMQILVSHEFMMGRRMMLGEIIDFWSRIY